MSGASGNVAPVIHMTPEVKDTGVIAKIRSGDTIRLDIDEGVVELLLSEAELENRQIDDKDFSTCHYAMGRELFASMRFHTSGAEGGATVFRLPGEETH